MLRRGPYGRISNSRSQKCEKPDSRSTSNFNLADRRQFFAWTPPTKAPGRPALFAGKFPNHEDDSSQQGLKASNVVAQAKGLGFRSFADFEPCKGDTVWSTESRPCRAEEMCLDTFPRPPAWAITCRAFSPSGGGSRSFPRRHRETEDGAQLHSDPGFSHLRLSEVKSPFPRLGFSFF